jgi:hypothetical protein
MPPLNPEAHQRKPFDLNLLSKRTSLHKNNKKIYKNRKWRRQEKRRKREGLISLNGSFTVKDIILESLR